MTDIIPHKLIYKIYGLYLNSDPTQTIRYVGRTSSILSTRLSKHRTNAKFAISPTKRSNWINKHWLDVNIILLEDNIRSIDEVKEKEKFYIKKYFGNGLVNATEGGEDCAVGYKHTEEAKKKIGNAHRGKKLSSEHVNSLKTRIVSDETRKKLSISSLLTTVGENNPMFGRKRPDVVARNKSKIGTKASPETKMKMSLMRRGQNNPNYKDGSRMKKN